MKPTTGLSPDEENAATELTRHILREIEDEAAPHIRQVVEEAIVRSRGDGDLFLRRLAEIETRSASRDGTRDLLIMLSRWIGTKSRNDLAKAITSAAKASMPPRLPRKRGAPKGPRAVGFDDEALLRHFWRSLEERKRKRLATVKYLLRREAEKLRSGERPLRALRRVLVREGENIFRDERLSVVARSQLKRIRGLEKSAQTVGFQSAHASWFRNATSKSHEVATEK